MDIVEEALQVLEKRMFYNPDAQSFQDSVVAKSYMQLKLAEYEHEVFAAIFLCSRHRFVAYPRTVLWNY